MKISRASVITVVFVLISLYVMGLLLVQNQATALNFKNMPMPSYTPAKEFLDYKNAPAITQIQKDNTLEAASKSNVYNEYIKYPHGPVNYVWAYPYTGAIHMSTIVNSNTGEIYGLLWVDVDYDGNVKNSGFTNWNKYW